MCDYFSVALVFIELLAILCFFHNKKVTAHIWDSRSHLAVKMAADLSSLLAALKVQEPPPKIDPPNSLAAPLPLNAPIERSGQSFETFLHCEAQIS
jgi:hypothetical protein